MSLFCPHDSFEGRLWAALAIHFKYWEPGIATIELKNSFTFFQRHYSILKFGTGKITLGKYRRIFSELFFVIHCADGLSTMDDMITVLCITILLHYKYSIYSISIGVMMSGYL